MRKFLYCLLTFLIIGSAAGGAVLFSNLSYSDNRGGDFNTPQNSITATAPDNSDFWITSGNYADAFAGGSGTESDPYQIETAAQLARLAYLINTSSTNSTYRSLYYKQTANIDLSAHYWAGIGSGETYYFSGIYDGGGFTITGLFTRAGSTTTYSYQGLFGYIYGTSSLYAEVHDVTISGSEIQGYEYIGAIAGFTRYAYIYNCANLSPIVASGIFSGGIIGYNYSPGLVRVYNCYNTGNVSGLGNVGGIAGFSNQYIYNCYNTGDITGGSSGETGGIVGRIGYGSVYSCYNLGTVQGTSDTGGIAGRNDYSLYNCYNRGDVYGYSYVGGITGWDSGYSSRHASIHVCYNTGTVNGSTQVGGIAGHIDATISFYSFVTNCVNLGAIETSSTSRGAIVGYIDDSSNYGGKVSYCYWGGDCTLASAYGTNNGSVSNCGTCTVENAKDQSWYPPGWDFENTWTIIDGVNDGYPVLEATLQITVTYNNNFTPSETISETKVGSGASFTIASYDLFARTGYELSHWNTSPTGSGVNYYAGDVYTGGASLTLYAQWEPAVYRIELNANDGAGGLSAMYVKYNTGFYSNSTATAGLSSLSDSNLPTRAGYTLLGFYTANSTSSTCLISVTTNSSGVRTGTFTDAFTTTYFTGQATIYAQWEANNPAYYDEAGGYWYIENGRLPQTRVTDAVTISALNANWSTLEKGTTYAMGSVGGMVAKIYGGKEYCRANGNFYIVEPIRWRLTSNPNQEVGYGTTDDTYAILDTIVYTGRYSMEELGAGNGYQNVAVPIFAGNQISTTYLVTETKSMPTFGTGANLYGDPQNVTDYIFVSSREEIMEVVGTYKIEFSDFVNDYLTNVRGSIPLYYTRDLGTNYNHAICLTEDGEVVQRQPDQIYNQLGVQFTIKVSEYACVER